MVTIRHAQSLLLVVEGVLWSMEQQQHHKELIKMQNLMPHSDLTAQILHF